MNQRARSSLAALVAVSVLGLLGMPCGTPDPRVVIATPDHGIFTTATSVSVAGVVLNPRADGTLRVNGVVTPVGGGGSFSATVNLTDIVNPILVRYTYGFANKDVRDRVTVFQGESIADGAFSPMGVALRLNDSGLDEAQSIVQSGISIDLATLVPVGLFLLTVEAVWDFDISVRNPAPSFSQPFGLDIDALSNGNVAANIDLNNVVVNVFLDGQGFLAPNCDGRITSSLVEVDGVYDLQADAGDPSLIDVVQQGNLSFGGTGFDFEITSGFLCEVAQFFGIIESDVTAEVQGALAGFLNDPDGSGPLDGPIADEVELALAEIEISGPLGQAVGVSLETPLFDVFEDVEGLTLDSDARITASMPDPMAVDLTASYHIPEPFPSFAHCVGGSNDGNACDVDANCPGGTCEALSPGALPYELAISLSTSAFNQLLKAEIESGLLIQNINEIAIPPVIPDPVPLTAGVLASVIPEFGTVDPDEALVLELRPTTAPLITGAPGPLGELAEMRIAQLQVNIRNNNLKTYLQGVVDLTVGLDITFAAGELSFTLGAVVAQEINVDIIRDKLGIFEATVESLLEGILPSALPDLLTSLESFPLPDFLGLQLGLVEVSKNGEYISLFLDLTPAP